MFFIDRLFKGRGPRQDYIFVIYDSARLSDGTMGLVGIPRGDSIFKGDSLKVLTDSGPIGQGQVARLESESGQELDQAEENSLVRLYLEDVDLKDLKIGDILYSGTVDESRNNPLKNKYLEGLLLERRLNNNPIIEERLFRQLLNFASFVSLIYKEGYIKSGERYYYPPIKVWDKDLDGKSREINLIPVFTSREELDKWAFYKDQELTYMDFDFLGELVEDLDNFQGFTINPFTDNLIIDQKNLRDLKRSKLREDSL